MSSTPALAAPSTDTNDPGALARRLAAAAPALDLFQRVAAVRAAMGGTLVFTTSFGLEDQAIGHAILTQALKIDIVTLDTGRLFPETHDVWAETERRYGCRIRAIVPDRHELEALIDRQGSNGFRASAAARRACCHVRKVAPLNRALAGAQAWITGLRSDQSEHRAEVAFAEFDGTHRVVKINPLFDWTRARRISRANTMCRSMRCMSAAFSPSAAPPARGRSRPASRNAPAVGGGRPMAKPNAACTAIRCTPPRRPHRRVRHHE